ncbi:enoyl-CoA hydratase/carnithine racemase [Burkholderia sp. Ch1-1]|nr:enoyl-CoA hydratase/carnithine racemase [Burkholderia sp. Ch1-1]
MTGTVDVIDQDRVRYLTIRRESRANALSIAMLGTLADAIATASRGNAIDMIVLQAEGANFCAGADMGELKTHRREQYAALRALLAALDARDVPMLCVLRGKTLGAGCMLPALADAVIAPGDAMLGFPEMRFGMYPSLIHAVLAQKLPVPLVHAICVGARFLDAREASAIGLLTDVLDAQDFTTLAHERVAFYAARTAALRYGREMLHESADEMLLARVDRAERLIDRNLAEPAVGAMLAGYRK